MAHLRHDADRLELSRYLKSLAFVILTALALIAPARPSGAVSDCAADIGMQTPVVFVHGFTSSAGMWSVGRPSMLAAVEKLSNFYAETFDYRAAATEWVDDSRLGPSLAKRIVCLAKSSIHQGGAGKVIVVAHSLGGLVTRYAAAQTVDGMRVADALGFVVTIGTPYDGSFLLSGGKIERGISRLLQADCEVYSIPVALASGDASLSGVCDFLSHAHSPAATAMVPGSKQLRDLPAWPKSLPVQALAGHVKGIGYTLFNVPLYVPTNNDFAVTVSSARKGGNRDTDGGGATTIDCPVWHIRRSLPPCMHTKEESNAGIQVRVVKAIRAYRSSQLKAILCPPSAGRCLGTRTGDIDGNGRADQVGLTVSGANYGQGVLTARSVLDNEQLIEQVLTTDAYPILASWLGLTDVNGDRHLDLFVVPTGGAHRIAVSAFEFREGRFEPLRGDVGKSLFLDGSYAFYGGFSCRTIGDHWQLVEWGANLNSNPPGRYEGGEIVFQADSSGVMVRVENRQLSYPATATAGGRYSPPSAVINRTGAHCPGLDIYPKV